MFHNISDHSDLVDENGIKVLMETNYNDLLKVWNNRYTCKLCGKNYKHKQTFYRHIKGECDFIGAYKRYQCPICLYCCKRKDNLYRHIQSMHKMECTLSNTNDYKPSDNHLYYQNFDYNSEDPK